MGAALQVAEDKQLTPAEVEEITGIPRSHPVAQRNRLRKWGIKAELNARREVVVFWSWIAAAALPETAKDVYLQPDPQEDSEDIGMNLRALHG